MRFSKNGLGWAGACALVLAACSGKLQDVGDINGDEPGGQGNVAGEGLAGEGDPVIPHAGTNGTGGAAGTGAVTGDAGKPNEPPIEGLECDDCELVAEAVDIRDIASNANDVFWVEHGTFDSLGNHEGNGRLMSAPLAGGEPLALASNLEGPIGVEVSSGSIYVLVERSSADVGGKQLLRLSLDGNDLEAEETLHPTLGETEDDYIYDWFRRKFFVNAGTAYILNDPMVVTLAEGDSGPASPFANMGTTEIYSILGDASLLYLLHTAGISTLPYSDAHGTPASLMTFGQTAFKPRYRHLAIQDDYIYGLDSIGPNDLNALPSYVVRAPVAGGAWKRIAEYAGSLMHLRIDGPDYFVDPSPLDGAQVLGCSIVQGNLTDPMAKTTLMRSSGDAGVPNAITDCMLIWDISPSFVYFRYEEVLYRVPRAN